MAKFISYVKNKTAEMVAAAKEEKRRKIESLRSKVSEYNTIISKLSNKKIKYLKFQNELTNYYDNICLCKNNTAKIYDSIVQGVKSSNLTRKFITINDYARSLGTKAGSLDVVLSELNKKIIKIDEEIEINKLERSRILSQLSALGG